MNRREFLRRTALTAGAVAALGAQTVAAAAPARPGAGPYGPLQPPDGNGLMLPRGFRSRVVATSLHPVGTTGYVWHAAPDGGATFATSDGGWIYTCNSELGSNLGGVGALRFDRSGAVVDAYSTLIGTSANCAGGATPWGTWLSCEEALDGEVWETDPFGRRAALPRPELGRFVHEAVAVDPRRRQLYLTEDTPDGRLYRFTPARYPDLSRGRLEALAASGSAGRATWLPVRDPSAASAPTRDQVPEATPFNGGEGIWYDAGFVYFTTKGDDRVWVYDTVDSTLEVLYDAREVDDAPLTGVDNIVVSRSGDLVVAEDGGDMDLVLITPERVVARLVRVVGQDWSELTGLAFDPSGTRLYFSSQLGPEPAGAGVTYEVSGPFRTQRRGSVTPPAPVASR